MLKIPTLEALAAPPSNLRVVGAEHYSIVSSDIGNDYASCDDPPSARAEASGSASERAAGVIKQLIISK